MLLFLFFINVSTFSHLQAYSDGIPDFPGPLLPEQEKKKGRNKRAPKGGEKPASRYKKRKKEGDERQLMHSGPDSVMTQIKQVRLIFITSYHAPKIGWSCTTSCLWEQRMVERL